MSASRLRAAAKVLRERAEAATPGPWFATGNALLGDNRTAIAIFYEDRRYADAELAATMAPPVALALADWLDEIGRLVGNHAAEVAQHHEVTARGDDCGCATKDCYECGYWHSCWHRKPDATHPLATAVAILGYRA